MLAYLDTAAWQGKFKPADGEIWPPRDQKMCIRMDSCIRRSGSCSQVLALSRSYQTLGVESTKVISTQEVSAFRETEIR